MDWVRIAFCRVMAAVMMLKIGSRHGMTVVDHAMNIVYGLCLLGFTHYNAQCRSPWSMQRGWR
jgi:hypothetical protein